MSDEIKPGTDAAASKPKAPASIDLPKADVKDVTPAPDVAASQPARSETVEAIGRIDAPPHMTPVDTPPVRASGATMPVVGGAIAGAIFGLLGSTIHQNYAAPPVTVADGRVVQVEAAIAAVEKKAADAAMLEQRLNAQIKTIETRAAAIEQKAIAAEQKAVAADQKVAGLDQKAAGLEQKAAGLISPVTERLAAAEAKLAESRDVAGQMAKRIELLAQIEAPKVDIAPLVAPLVARLDALEKTLGSTSARVILGGEAAQALDQRIKAAEVAVGDLKAKKPGETPAAILGVSAALRRSLEAGEPLGAHLTALKGLGAPEAMTAPLVIYAEKPAPRLAGLADQLNGLVAALPKPKVETPAATGVMDKIKAAIWSQVDVKPVGGISADMGALTGRVRARLLAGDTTGALAEIATLTPEQREALKPFTDAASARAGALDALRKLEAEALAAAARKS